MTGEYVLREFVCKKCGHKVVVNPKLPADYTPTICTPCWDADEPVRKARLRELGMALHEFLGMLNNGDPPGTALQALQRRQRDRLS